MNNYEHTIIAKQDLPESESKNLVSKYETIIKKNSVFFFDKNIELNGFGDVFNNPKNIVPHHTVSSIINLQPASINLLDV